MIEDFAKEVESEFADTGDVCCYEELKSKTNSIIQRLDDKFKYHDEFRINYNTFRKLLSWKNKTPIVEKEKDLFDETADENQLFGAQSKKNKTADENPLSSAQSEEMERKYGFDIAYTYMLNKYYPKSSSNAKEISFSTKFDHFTYLQQISQFLNIEEAIIDIGLLDHDDFCDKLDNGTPDDSLNIIEETTNKIYKDIIDKPKIISNIKKIPIIEMLGYSGSQEFYDSLSKNLESTHDNLTNAIYTTFSKSIKHYNKNIETIFGRQNNSNLCKIFLCAFYQSVFYSTVVNAINYDSNSKSKIKKKLQSYKKSLDEIIDYKLINKDCINTEKITDWFKFIKIRVGGVNRVLVYVLKRSMNLNEKETQYMLKKFELKLSSFDGFQRDIEKIYQSKRKQGRLIGT